MASSSVALYDLSSQERQRKFSGHPAPVRALCFGPDESGLAFSGARGERHVAVWRLGDKKSSKDSAAAQVLSMDDPAVALAAAAGTDAGSVVCAALTEAGDAYVWRIPGDGGKAALVARVRVGSGAVKGARAGAGDTLLAVRFDSAAALVVAHGSTMGPSFQRVELPAAAPKDPLVSLRAAAGKAEEAEQRRKQAAAGEAGEVLGADNAGAAVQLRTTADKRRRPEEEEEEEAVDLGEDSAPEDEGQALGERVAALELEGRSAPAGTRAAAGAAAAAAGGPVRADSLSVLLTQALRSEDRALLERCLSVGNERIIRNTVRRLLPMDAAAFLKAAIERLQSKPARGSQLSHWIRAVLVFHAGYLMAAPGVQPYLTSLYQAIESRLSTYRSLLGLSGRLDLLSAQLQGKAGDAAEGEDGEEGSGPAVVYQEESEEEDEEGQVEDAMHPDGLESDDEEDSEEEGDSDDLEEDEDEDLDGDMMGMGSDEDDDSEDD